MTVTALQAVLEVSPFSVVGRDWRVLSSVGRAETRGRRKRESVEMENCILANGVVRD